MAATPSYSSPSAVATLTSSSPSVIREYYSFGADTDKSGSLSSDANQHPYPPNGPPSVPVQIHPFGVTNHIELEHNLDCIPPRPSTLSSPSHAFSGLATQSSPGPQNFSAASFESGVSSLPPQVPPQMGVTARVTNTRLSHDGEISPLCGVGTSPRVPLELSSRKINTNDALTDVAASATLSQQPTPGATINPLHSPSPPPLPAFVPADARAASFSVIQKNEKKSPSLLASCSEAESAITDNTAPIEGAIIHRLSFSNDLQPIQSPPQPFAVQHTSYESSSGARPFSASVCSPPLSLQQGSLKMGIAGNAVVAASPAQQGGGFPSLSFQENSALSAGAQTAVQAETIAANSAASDAAANEFNAYKPPSSTNGSSVITTFSRGCEHPIITTGPAHRFLGSLDAAVTCDPISPAALTTGGEVVPAAGEAANLVSYHTVASNAPPCSPPTLAPAVIADAPLDIGDAGGPPSFAGRSGKSANSSSPSSFFFPNADGAAPPPFTFSPCTLLSPAGAVGTKSSPLHHSTLTRQRVSSSLPPHANSSQRSVETDLKSFIPCNDISPPMDDPSEILLQKVLRGERTSLPTPAFTHSPSSLRKQDAYESGTALSAEQGRKEGGLLLTSLGIIPDGTDEAADVKNAHVLSSSSSFFDPHTAGDHRPQSLKNFTRTSLVQQLGATVVSLPGATPTTTTVGAAGGGGASSSSSTYSAAPFLKRAPCALGKSSSTALHSVGENLLHSSSPSALSSSLRIQCSSASSSSKRGQGATGRSTFFFPDSATEISSEGQKCFPTPQRHVDGKRVTSRLFFDDACSNGDIASLEPTTVGVVERSNLCKRGQTDRRHSATNQDPPFSLRDPKYHGLPTTAAVADITFSFSGKREEELTSTERVPFAADNHSNTHVHCKNEYSTSIEAKSALSPEVNNIPPSRDTFSFDKYMQGNNISPEGTAYQGDHGLHSSQNTAHTPGIHMEGGLMHNNSTTTTAAAASVACLSDALPPPRCPGSNYGKNTNSSYLPISPILPPTRSTCTGKVGGAGGGMPRGQRSNSSRSSSISLPQLQQQRREKMADSLVEEGGHDNEGVEIVGGVRQNAALLPVFETKGEMITHGSKYGGDQPAALRGHKSGTPLAGATRENKNVKINKNSLTPDSGGAEDDEDALRSRCINNGESGHGESSSDAVDWKAAWQQAVGESRTLRRRLQEAEFQIFSLQQSLSKESARAAAQTKQQVTLETALRSARAEFLHLRHTLRLHLRGLDLPAGAVVGGAADVRREATLMRQALQEAANYNAELLEQNESLRVRVNELECGLLSSLSNEKKDTISGGEISDSEKKEREELHHWRAIFEQLQATSGILVGDATPANMEILLDQQMRNKKRGFLRNHKTSEKVSAVTNHTLTSSPAVLRGVEGIQLSTSTVNSIVPAVDPEIQTGANVSASASADQLASVAAMNSTDRTPVKGTAPHSHGGKSPKKADGPLAHAPSTFRKKESSSSVKTNETKHGSSSKLHTKDPHCHASRNCTHVSNSISNFSEEEEEDEIVYRESPGGSASSSKMTVGGGRSHHGKTKAVAAEDPKSGESDTGGLSLHMHTVKRELPASNK